MAMTVMVTGYMYNGAVHSYTQKGRNGADDQERDMFRGRLNYRDKTNGEYYWIDAVCWKDFGQNGGLVGFLENNFLAEDGPKEKGGQTIELVGYIRPKTGQHTATISVKKGGKIVPMDVPNVEYPTYEFVIESADYPPSSEKTGKKKSTGNFEDAIEIDDDEFEIVGGATKESAPEKDDNSDIDTLQEEDNADDASDKSEGLAKEEDDDFFNN